MQGNFKRPNSLHRRDVREHDALALPVTDHVGEVLDVCRNAVQGEVSTTVLCVGRHGRRLGSQLSFRSENSSTMKTHSTVHEYGKDRYPLTSSLLQVVCASWVCRPIVDAITTYSFSSYIRLYARAPYLTYGVSGALSQVVTPTLPPPRL